MAVCKYYLKGMLIDDTYETNEYLIYSLLVQNKTNDLDRWNKEYLGLCEVPNVKETGTHPSIDFLYQNTIGFFEDSLLEFLDEEIESIKEDFKVQIIYNRQALYDCIIDYYNWLIHILSNDGIITIKDKEKKINELIQKYNKAVGGV